LTVHPTGVPGEGVVFSGDLGHFLSLWTAVVVCFFAYVGFETIALTAAENKDLETYETIKMGSRKLTMRISILYIICTFTASLNVPYDDPMLMDIRLSSTLGSQHSIFVIMAVRNHLRGWPSFFTGFFIFSATTSAINAVYNSARLLHALASIPEAWPLSLQKIRKRLEHTSARGVPLGAIAVSWSFGLLAFLALKPFPSVVHGRIVQFVTVCCLISYGGICLAFTQFYKRIAEVSKDPTVDNRSAFNREHEQYPYRSRGQSLRAYYGLIFCALLVIFNDWTVFVRPFNTGEFVAAYIAPVALFAIVAAYHIRSDGWNPFKWRRNASMQIMRPPPKVVVPGRRRGRLQLPNPKLPLWERQNLQAIVSFIWVWLK
jgi:amino acid transporter